MHFALCLLALAPLSTVDDPKLDGPLHMEREAIGRYEVTLTETLTDYKSAPEKWTVSMPLPPNYEAQAIKSPAFYIPSDPKPRLAVLKEKAGLGQSYLSATFLHSEGRPVTAQGIFEVTLYKRKLVEGASTEKPFPLGDQKDRYTSTHPWLDMTNPDFKAWVEEEKLLQEEKETDLKYAWRVFKYIATYFSYDGEAEGLTPMTTVRAKKSNTLGLANLYLAILRAQNIPSRFVVCRPLFEFKDQIRSVLDMRLDEETTDILVEFWTPELGWVPTDIVHAASFHEPADYFGKCDGQFIALHFDMFQFELGQYSFFERLNWLSNNVENSLEKAKVRRKLELRKL